MKALLKIILLYAVCASASAKDVIIEQPQGYINWSSGRVVAVGEAAIPEKLKSNNSAKRILVQKAKLMAYRNLAEMVSGIRVTSETLVKDMMLTSDIVKSSVSAIIKGAQVTQINETDDSITVSIELDTKKGLVKTILPKEQIRQQFVTTDAATQLNWLVRLQTHLSDFKQIPFFAKAYAQNTSQFPSIQNSQQLEYAKQLQIWLDTQKNDAAKPLTKAITAFEQNSTYTGLLIDARDISDFNMAVLPVIRNEVGKIIFPSEQSNYGDLINRRPVSYDFELQDAKTNKRIAMAPYIARALKTFKSRKSDLVISNQDAEIIRKNHAIVGNINKAAVMIVVAE